MQVFAPTPRMRRNMVQLDDRRLVSQINELKVLITAMQGGYDRSWVNHRVCRLYWGHRKFLKRMRKVAIEVAWDRGIDFEEDEMYEEAKQMTFGFGEMTGSPDWWGNEEYHDAYKVALFAKDPQHYKRYLDAGKINREVINKVRELWAMPQGRDRTTAINAYATGQLVYPMWMNGGSRIPFEDSHAWYLPYFQDGVPEDSPYMKNLGKRKKREFERHYGR